MSTLITFVMHANPCNKLAFCTCVAMIIPQNSVSTFVSLFVSLTVKFVVWVATGANPEICCMLSV